MNPRRVSAFEAIQFIGVIPMSIERPCTNPTNAEIKRWLDQGAVVINGIRPKAKDQINFPITSLVFFPKAPRKTTVI